MIDKYDIVLALIGMSVIGLFTTSQVSILSLVAVSIFALALVGYALFAMGVGR